MTYIFRKASFLFVVVLTLFACIGCSAPQNKIVGVWEMQEVDINQISQAPRAAITNKKDIYTSTGVYHDTAADSTTITDTNLRNYKIEGDELTITQDGRKVRGGKISFPTERTLVIENGGVKVTFQKVSNNPDEIPALEEKMVKVKFQGKTIN